MSKKKPSVPLADYGVLLGQIKDRIQQSQARAALAVNAELIRLYWDIGRLLEAKQRDEGWGRRSFYAWPMTFRTRRLE